MARIIGIQVQPSTFNLVAVIIDGRPTPQRNPQHGVISTTEHTSTSFLDQIIIESEAGKKKTKKGAEHGPLRIPSRFLV